jgi:general stress protein YciG
VKKTAPTMARWFDTGSEDPALLELEMRKPMAESKHTGNPGNFAEDREKAARAGHIGGQHSSGNFANDRERAAEAGRKGGQSSHGSSHGSHDSGASGSREAQGGGAQHNPTSPRIAKRLRRQAGRVATHHIEFLQRWLK